MNQRQETLQKLYTLRAGLSYISQLKGKCDKLDEEITTWNAFASDVKTSIADDEQKIVVYQREAQQKVYKAPLKQVNIDEVMQETRRVLSDDRFYDEIYNDLMHHDFPAFIDRKSLEKDYQSLQNVNEEITAFKEKIAENTQKREALKSHVDKVNEAVDAAFKSDGGYIFCKEAELRLDLAQRIFAENNVDSPEACMLLIQELQDKDLLTLIAVGWLFGSHVEDILADYSKAEQDISGYKTAFLNLNEKAQKKEIADIVRQIKKAKNVDMCIQQFYKICLAFALTKEKYMPYTKYRPIFEKFVNDFVEALPRYKRDLSMLLYEIKAGIESRTDLYDAESESWEVEEVLYSSNGWLHEKEDEKAEIEGKIKKIEHQIKHKQDYLDTVESITSEVTNENLDRCRKFFEMHPEVKFGRMNYDRNYEVYQQYNNFLSSVNSYKEMNSPSNNDNDENSEDWRITYTRKKIQESNELLQKHNSEIAMRQGRIDALAKEAKKLYELLVKENFDLLVPEQWENLDIVIYYVYNGYADTTKEALVQKRDDDRTNAIVDRLQTMEANIVGTINAGFDGMRDIMVKGFTLMSHQLSAIQDQVYSNTAETLRLHDSLIDINNNINFSNSLLQKANASCAQLVSDTNYMCTLASAADVRRRNGS